MKSSNTSWFRLNSPNNDLYRCTVYVQQQVQSVFKTNLWKRCCEMLNVKLIINHSVRWITRLADRWRAQQSAITIANCRIYWAAISWTQMAVLGIPETTFAWGSILQHSMYTLSCSEHNCNVYLQLKIELATIDLFLQTQLMLLQVDLL